MKEKIEKKIEAIVDYIISKPESAITQEDYMIIASEVRDIRFRELESARQERMEQLLTSVSGAPGFSGFAGSGCSSEGKEQ